jgi:Zn-dependent M28 family amino/carboxypeptidase
MWRRNDVSSSWNKLWLVAGTGLISWVIACGGSSQPKSESSSASASTAVPPAVAGQAGQASKPAEVAPPADQTGGFDGAKAFDQVAKIVSFGPRPPASDGIHQVQSYIISQLRNSGCEVEQDDFHASTPVGDVAMKNIVAKAPGTGPGIILLLTHYDSLGSVKDFVGAEDSASSTGVMIEMARQLCAKKGSNSVWMAFLDGEEAFVNWDQNDDHTYGSRELAARMALSGDLKRVKAVILADMIGQYGVQLAPESSSTKWLVDVVWKTAERLGHKDIFPRREVAAVSDDHDPFLSRGLPAVDIIDLGDYTSAGYWHTSQDTIDKVSPRNLAIVGQVIMESVGELQKKFH